MREYGSEYILHTEYPRFLARVVLLEPEIEVITWFDYIGFQSPDKSGVISAERMAKLMRETGEWYQEYCDWEENRYGDEIEDDDA